MNAYPSSIESLFHTVAALSVKGALLAVITGAVLLVMRKKIVARVAAWAVGARLPAARDAGRSGLALVDRWLVAEVAERRADHGGSCGFAGGDGAGRRSAGRSTGE